MDLFMGPIKNQWTSNGQKLTMI
uniref:Uncharacterized protein n=1 Tax=Tetranychus urticae TaxID=32264 RepID=T1KDS9_TETUR